MARHTDLELISVKFPKQLVRIIDGFCKEHERTRSYVIRKGAEIFLDVFHDCQRRLNAAAEKINVIGENIDETQFPKVHQIAQVNTTIIENNLKDIMKTKNIGNRYDALVALEKNL